MNLRLQSLVTVLLLSTAVTFCFSANGATYSDLLVYKGAYTAGSGCAAPPMATSFTPADQQIHFYLLIQGMTTSDNVQVRWIFASTGEFVRYNTLTASSNGNWCFPFGYANISDLRQGQWELQVYNNDQYETQSYLFSVGASSTSTTTSVLSLTGISRSQLPTGNSSVGLFGTGFVAQSAVAVCCQNNTPNGADVGVVPGGFQADTQLNPSLSLSDPGTFTIQVYNPDGQKSSTIPILVGYSGYFLPFVQGTAVTVQQGNNDTPDHHGLIAWAYDLTGPTTSETILAMKGGRVILAPDSNLGLGQTCSPSDHGFGNYITIDHLNGEYSQYPHLLKNSFLVSDGQLVTQGQALATIGNSGYTGYLQGGTLVTCAGRGIHIHAQVTRSPSIYSQSVPFLFDEAPAHNPSAPPPGEPIAGDILVSRNVNAPSTPAASEADIAWTGIRARAKSDSRFGSEISNTENYNPNWGGGTNGLRDLRSIQFNFSGGRAVTIFHAFYNNATSNLGATIFWDPDASAWTAWVNVH